MIHIDKVEIFNLEGAVRGMRNPLNSWDKSESYTDLNGKYVIGENDLSLMKKLVSAGSDERKFMRQILVSLDIESPFYWWKQFSTYRVGVVQNSTSTMHKLHTRDLTVEDFSHEHLAELEMDWLVTTINLINHNRKLYNETKDKKYWYRMIQILPTSYNQKRTITLNYEVLRNMYHARKHHKLDEWRELCAEIEKFPYSELITMEAKVAK